MPVREFTDAVIGLTAPARDEVWVATRTADGTVALQHKVGSAWSDVALPVRVEVSQWDKATLHGTAANDVWLAVAGSLFHFDGGAWVKVAVPGGATVTALRDVPGHDVYVGTLAQDAGSSAVYRVSGSTWTSLGAPEQQGGRQHVAQEIRIVDGRVFVEWSYPSFSALYQEHVDEYRDGVWNTLFTTEANGGGSYLKVNAWLVPDASTHLAFGWKSNSGFPYLPECSVHRTDGKPVNPCTSQVAVSAGALLGDGRVVLGGEDYRDQRDVSAPIHEASFVVRDAAGVETPLTGTPGDKTLFMAVEPGTEHAWAVTQAGGTIQLQEWRG